MPCFGLSVSVEPRHFGCGAGLHQGQRTLCRRKTLLVGRFPADTIYPDFAILIVRRRFDEIMLENAIAQGAKFEGHAIVRGFEYEGDCVRVFGESTANPFRFTNRHRCGRTSLTVSRAIGRPQGRRAWPLVVPPTGVSRPAARRQSLLQSRYFPSYGWVSVDDHGSACVGIGCAVDRNFPIADNLSYGLRRLIDTDLTDTLADATRCGPFGAISGYYAESDFADRVMLIGVRPILPILFIAGNPYRNGERLLRDRGMSPRILPRRFLAWALKRYENFWSHDLNPIGEWRRSSCRSRRIQTSRTSLCSS